MNFCELVVPTCRPPLLKKVRRPGCASLALQTPEVFNVARSSRSDIADDVEKAQVQQPRRPADQQRRGMGRLAALQEFANRLEQPARIGAAAKLAAAFVLLRGLGAALRRALPRRFDAEGVAQDLLRTAQQLLDGLELDREAGLMLVEHGTDRLQLRQ